MSDSLDAGFLTDEDELLLDDPVFQEPEPFIEPEPVVDVIPIPLDDLDDDEADEDFDPEPPPRKTAHDVVQIFPEGSDVKLQDGSRGTVSKRSGDRYTVDVPGKGSKTVSRSDINPGR